MSAFTFTGAAPWSAVTALGAIRWREGTLTGSPTLMQLVEEALALPEPVLVTPTGPSVERDLADPVAVLAVVLSLDLPGVRFAGAVPDSTCDVPVGAES